MILKKKSRVILFISSVIILASSIIYLKQIDQYILNPSSEICITNNSSLLLDSISAFHVFEGERYYDSVRLNFQSNCIKLNLPYGKNGFSLYYCNKLLLRTGFFNSHDWKPISLSFTIKKSDNGYEVTSELCRRLEKDIVKTSIVQ